MDELKLFEWLQKWYRSQCDENWEHEYGIKIETVDNPGWYVTINLKNTGLEQRSFSPVEVEKDEINWYFCLVRNNNFEASGGPCNLNDIIKVFHDWAHPEN